MKLLKRAVSLIFPAVLAVVFTACTFLPAAGGASSAASEQPKLDENTVRFPAAGYSLQFTEGFSGSASEGVFSYSEAQNGKEQDGTPYTHKLYADFMPFEALPLINEMEQSGDEITKEQKNDYLKTIYASMKNVFFITVYNKDVLNMALTGGKDISAVTGAKNNRLVGEQEGLVYYLSTPEADVSGLSALSKTAYEALLKGAPDVMQSIRFFQPEKQDG